MSGDSDTGIVGQLERLNALHASGALDSAEFLLAKGKVLGTGKGTAAREPQPRLHPSVPAVPSKDGLSAGTKPLKFAPKTRRRTGAGLRRRETEAGTGRRARRREAHAAVPDACLAKSPSNTAAVRPAPGAVALDAAAPSFGVRDVLAGFLVVVASVSFTLRILEILRVLLSCGASDVPLHKQPIRCRVGGLALLPALFTLTVLVVGRCFGAGAVTRCYVEHFYGALLPHRLMAKFREHILVAFPLDESPATATELGIANSMLACLPGRGTTGGQISASPTTSAITVDDTLSPASGSSGRSRRRGTDYARRTLESGEMITETGGPIETSTMKLF